MLVACRTETKKQRCIKLNSLFAKVKQKLLEVLILDPLYTELFVYLFLTFQPPWWKFSRCEFLRQGTKFLGICPNGKDTIGSIPVSPWEIWDFFRRRRWGDVIVYIYISWWDGNTRYTNISYISCIYISIIYKKLLFFLGGGATISIHKLFMDSSNQNPGWTEFQPLLTYRFAQHVVFTMKGIK